MRFGRDDETVIALMGQHALLPVRVEDQLRDRLRMQESTLPERCFDGRLQSAAPTSFPASGFGGRLTPGILNPET